VSLRFTAKVAPEATLIALLALNEPAVPPLPIYSVPPTIVVAPV
jgi:hypothetical protein